MSSNRNHDWTLELTSVAARLYLEGKSAAEVAAILKADHGVYLTRNAVIGKLNRIGVAQQRASTPSLPKPAKTNIRFKAPAGLKAPKVAKVTKTKLKKPDEPRLKVIVAGNGSTFVHENFRKPKARANTVPADIAIAPRHWETRRAFGECAFPIEREEGVFSCCNPTADGKSYCAQHYALMYMPPVGAWAKFSHPSFAKKVA